MQKTESSATAAGAGSRENPLPTDCPATPIDPSGGQLLPGITHSSSVASLGFRMLRPRLGFPSRAEAAIR